MKSIGIVICNFNKRDYIVNCIRSILAQSISDFDIYVVDNASTDDSVEIIKKEFGTSVDLIINKVNCGGSGGFNTGMRKALEKNYKYIMCVDNDIVMDSSNIEELYKFLEGNKDIALVGSKICKMDEPEIIMALGSTVNYENYEYKDNYKGCRDNDEIPEMVHCDYVPACSLMVRTSVIKEVGLMKESNFIYWDDIDWAFRMRKAGYRAAAISKAKIWHKGGGTNPTNTFPDYYFWRNKITFFSEHLAGEKLNEFIDTLLQQLFQYIYGSFYKGKNNLIKTIMYAYDDAIHGVNGKAEDYKIMNRSSGSERNILNSVLESSKNVLIQLSDNMCINMNNNEYMEEKKSFAVEDLVDIIKQFMSIKDDLNINVLNSNEGCSIQEIQRELNNRTLKEKLIDKTRIEVVSDYNCSTYDVTFKIYNHVTEINNYCDKFVYIDKFNNCVATEEQLNYYKNYENMLDIFKASNKELLTAQIKKIRDK